MAQDHWSNSFDHPTIISFLEQVKNDMDKKLQREFPFDLETNAYESTYDAMRYIIFLGGGGKRIRPAITIAACEACGGHASRANSFALAIEKIHSYSLIIDDIQDRDDVRRGEPACHIAFGIDTALLAAMRLFEQGLEPFHQLGPPHAGTVRLLLDQLHRGQCADLNSLHWPSEHISFDALVFIYKGKTSSLFQLALLGGAASAGATNRQTKALLEFGFYLGLAYQARDDILDLHDISKQTYKAATISNQYKVDLLRICGDETSATNTAKEFARKGKEALDKVFGDEAYKLRAMIEVAANRDR